MTSAATAGRHLYLLPVLLNLWMAAASGLEVQIDPKCAQVGATVTFSVLDAGNILVSGWYRGNTNDADNQILTVVNNVQTNGVKYIPGARGLVNGSLVIPNIQKDHEGNYTVNIQNDKAQQNKSVYLQVKDKCSEAPSGLSPGGIAGIVIAVLAVVAAVVGGVIYKFTRKGPEGPL